jgi:hypothetical protein
MRVSDEEYQKHTVFTDLERFIAFYEDLALSVFGFFSVGTRAMCNIDSYLFSSVQGTLVSIQAILRDGRVNDAYALLRKYYDSAIINIYTSLYLDDQFSIENLIVEQIDRWLQGKQQLPELKVMIEYIRKSQRVTPITALLNADDRYKRLRARCNDHVHYNFYRNVLLNDKEIFLEGRLRALEQFSNDLRDVVILHVSYMFFANEHYMISSDYVDSLECGMTPEPDSQFWVAPFVQEIFDLTVKKSRPDIAAIIKQHSSMHLA